ncbi:hypothetical protein B0T20DRAFT_208146 [Sordaria brevicollis]|uniref:Uncharacterized protein n=1 Tax=Sordaria brevicollis TaxID=83679 RepID=A0AAE0UBW4_SORBR|nr:hypothetical protein B0T20DRAFT_208146 [Sordaria brevicollis]
MFLPSVVLQLAVVALLPVTATAQLTTSFLAPNNKPTLQVRDHGQDIKATAVSSVRNPSPTKIPLRPSNTLEARYQFPWETNTRTYDSEAPLPTWRAIACPGANPQLTGKMKSSIEELPDDWGWAPATNLSFALMDREWYSGQHYLASASGRDDDRFRVCKRAGCVGFAAFYWCNMDQMSKLELRPEWILKGAVDIYKTEACWSNKADFWGKGNGFVRGEVFHKDQWSVLVRKEDCRLGAQPVS